MLAGVYISERDNEKEEDVSGKKGEGKEGIKGERERKKGGEGGAFAIL